MNTTIKILAIETASEACSAALLISDEDGHVKIHKQIELAPRQHAKKILSLLDKVLEECATDLKEVDAIAFGRGPGAFTGLRIAAGVAQGVALSVDKPVVPVSTLAALALKTVKQGETKIGDRIVTALDARMGEVYWASFQQVVNGGVELKDKEQVSKPEEMYKALQHEQTKHLKMIAVGAGWDAYEEALFGTDMAENTALIDANPVDRNLVDKNLVHKKGLFPEASEIAELALGLFKKGETVSPENAQPVYIRNDVAKKSQKLLKEQKVVANSVIN